MLDVKHTCWLANTNPSLDAKLEKWPHVKKFLDPPFTDPEMVKATLADLTYFEMDDLQQRLSESQDLDPSHIERLIGDAKSACVLESDYKPAGEEGGESESWRDACENQQQHVRLPKKPLS